MFGLQLPESFAYGMSYPTVEEPITPRNDELQVYDSGRNRMATVGIRAAAALTPWGAAVESARAAINAGHWIAGHLNPDVRNPGTDASMRSFNNILDGNWRQAYDDFQFANNYDYSQPARRRRIDAGESSRMITDGSSSSSSVGFNGMASAVTFQRDAVQTYRKRRVSRRTAYRAKKRRVRFQKKEVSLAANNIFRRVYSNATSITAGTQGIIYVPGLFSLTGSGGWDDMAVISGNMVWTQSNTVASGSYAAKNNSKIWIRDGSMEMDIANTGSGAIIIEIFTCMTRGYKNTSDPSGQYVLPSLVLNTGGQIPITQQYASPFDSYEFCKKNKILSCRKIYLNAGAATDMSMRKRGRMFDPEQLAEITGGTNYGVPGTIYWMLIVTGAPVATGGTPAAQFSACSVAITAERSYNVKNLVTTQPTAQNV